MMAILKEGVSAWFFDTDLIFFKVPPFPDASVAFDLIYQMEISSRCPKVLLLPALLLLVLLLPPCPGRHVRSQHLLATRPPRCSGEAYF